MGEDRGYESVEGLALNKCGKALLQIKIQTAAYCRGAGHIQAISIKIVAICQGQGVCKNPDYGPDRGYVQYGADACGEVSSPGSPDSFVYTK